MTMTLITSVFWLTILIAASTFSGLQAIKYNDYLFACFYGAFTAIGLKFILNIPIFSFIIYNPLISSLIFIVYLSIGVFYIIKIYWPRLFNDMFETYRATQFSLSYEEKIDKESFKNTPVFKDYFMADKNKNKIIIVILTWPADLIWNVAGHYIYEKSKKMRLAFFEMLFEKIDKNIPE